MDREEYLEMTRDNAINVAFALRMEELLLPTDERPRLSRRRLKLTDAAASYQRELIEIDARHQALNRPTQSEKDRMARLRDRVRNATRTRLGVTALLALANEVLDVVEEVKALST